MLAFGVDRVAGGDPAGPAAGVDPGLENRAGHAGRDGLDQVLASNGHIHDALLDLVRDLPSGRDYQALRA